MPTDDEAALVYRQATGIWPEGYTPPSQEAPADPHQAAAEAYKAATGHWPGETPPDAEQEEAPEDNFSHYLTLANGQTVRYAVDERRPNAPLPTQFNGVPVAQVHNAYPAGKESGQ
jgi:hypothetical protein